MSSEFGVRVHTSRDDCMARWRSVKRPPPPKARRFAAMTMVAASIGLTVVLVFDPDWQRAAAIATVAVVIPTFLAVSLALWQVEDPVGVADALAEAIEKEWSIRRFELLGKGVELADLSLRGLENNNSNATSNAVSFRLSTLSTFYTDLELGRLVVLGKPGSGKTVLAIEILLKLLEHRRKGRLKGVPLLLSLAGWDPAVPFESWLMAHLAQDYGMTRSAAQRVVDQHLVLPILDGLDEMGHRPASAESTTYVAVDKLNAALRGTRRLPLVLTCRTDFYHENLSGHRVKDAVVIEIEDLGEPEIRDYLARRYPDNRQSGEIDPKWSRVVARLQAKTGASLRRSLSTPWLLTITATAFDSKNITTSDLLKRRSRSGLEELLLPTLIPSALQMHPPRGVHRYSTDKVERWLARIAEHLNAQRNKGESKTDIRLSEIWQLAGGWRPRLLHALFAVPAAGLVCIVGAEAVAGTGGILLTSAFLLVGLSIGAWAAFDPRPAPSRVTFRGLHWRRRVGVGTLVAAYVFFSGLYTAGIEVALTTGVAAAIAAALVFGFRGGAVGALRPESTLRSDLVFGLALGLAGGVYVGLPGGLRGGVLSQIPWVRDVTVPAGGLLGIFLGVAAGLALGSRMFVRYAVSVAIEASAGRLPIRLARFLAWARDAGLLRESGPAYQFRHERFREWVERDRRGRLPSR